MVEGFGMGVAYAMNQNQGEFDKLASELRERLKITEAGGDIEQPLQFGMAKTMNAVIDEIREIEDGTRSPEQARLSSTTTGEHRVQFFQGEAKATSRRLSEGKFELDFKVREDLHKELPTTMHGCKATVKMKKLS